MKKLLLTIAMLGGSIFSVTSPLVSKAAEIDFIDSSDVIEDLKTNEKFNEDNYSINTSLSLEDGLKPITLYEYGYKSLIYYFHNESGLKLENSYKYRITLSNNYSSTYTNNYDVTFKKYDLNILDVSDDNKFVKFKVDYNSFSKKILERVYSISDFEIDLGEGYSKGVSIPLNETYIYSGIGETLKYEKKELETISLDVNADYYRTKTINASSTSRSPVYTDINYIIFPLKKNLGDLVKINLEWKEEVIDYYQLSSVLQSGKYTVDTIFKGFDNEIENLEWKERVYGENHNSGDPEKYKKYSLTYTNEDFNEATTIHSLSGWDQFRINTSIYTFWQDKNEEYILPVIEKVDFKDYNNLESYRVSENTKALFKDQYKGDYYLGYDHYIIRFSYSDFANNLAADYNALGLPRYERYVKQTIIHDCDVLDLTFLKDGKIFTLAVNHKPTDIEKNWDKPTFFNSIIAPWVDDFDNTLDVYNKLTIALGVLLSLFIIVLIIYFLYPSIKKWINKIKSKKKKK